AGSHTVVLSGIAANCGLPDGRSKGVMVTAGDTADAVFPITCYATGPSPSRSTISLDPATISVTGTSIIIVAVVDASGTPMPGIEVAVTATGTGNSIAPWPSAESGITNSSGVATFSFASTVPEAKTITATANGVILEATPVLTVLKGVSLVGVREIVPEPSTAGETIVVTVFVGGERGTRPTGGTVAVSSNLEPDAGCDAAPVSPEGGTVASATCEMTLSIVSTHMLSATYSGDSQYEGSSGTAVEHVVIAR
ncbi:MAG: Ig-like domain-containing protein, partial [Gemmatimonadales bacterium]